MISGCFIGAFIGSSICSFIAYKLGKWNSHLIISDRQDGWIDIQKHPIPNNVDDHESFSYILATDGRLVKSIYRAHPEYNFKGQQVLSSYGYQKPITHWMPYPAAPKIE